MSVVVADKGYDSEDNHVLVRELDAFSVIPARYEDVLIWKTPGSNKMVVWRTGYIKVGKNTERIII